MTIASEITRISGNIVDAYTALDGKGATMPATQNSANLADTIDTITTGGGGGSELVDFSESEFRAACAEVEQIIPSSNTLTTAEQHNAVLTAMQNNGWVLKDGKNGYLSSDSDKYKALQYVFTLTFSYDTKYVWFCCGYSNASKFPVAFKIPSTAEFIVDGYNTQNVSDKKFLFCVKFNGDERTILYAANSMNGNNSLSYALGAVDVPPKSSTATDTPNHQYGSPCGRKQLRAVKYYDINADTTSSNPEYYGPMLENLSGARIVESGRWVTYLASGKQTGIPDIKYVLRIGNVKDFSCLKDFYSSNFYDENLGIIKENSDTTFWTSGNLLKFLDYGMPNRKVFPIIVDMSAVTSTGTLQPFNNTSYNSYIAGIFMQEHTVYIKLPSTYTTVDLNGYSVSNQSSYKDSPCLTLESWQYMATNAPTVTSCTLKVGNQVYHMMKTWNITEYVAVATTLEGKGWTIAA